MSAARLLLSDDSLSLSEISERLGFSSQEYFSSSFKKFYGISPSHFKNINCDIYDRNKSLYTLALSKENIYNNDKARR